MMIKTLVCGVVLGCLPATTAMLDRGHAPALDSLAQMPACTTSDTQCQNVGSTTNGSTQRFFAMLSMQ